MVRLLLNCPAALLPSLPLFQSHNGAIAAKIFVVIAVKQGNFQSHNGAIAAVEPEQTTIIRDIFQSHNGAIAARNTQQTRNKRKTLSIPQWCDCCVLKSCDFAI